MVAHGAIIILIALSAGFGLVISLIGGFEVFPGTIVEFGFPGDPRAWARTHAGGIMNGLLVITGALVVHAMDLPEKTASRLYWMLVGTGYANTIFYWGLCSRPAAPFRSAATGSAKPTSPACSDSVQPWCSRSSR